MKKSLLALLAVGLALCSFAQTDTTVKEKVDTLNIGGMIIIKKKGDNREVRIENKRSRDRWLRRNGSNTSTNWLILDLGFAQFQDNTNYASALASGFLAPGMGGDNFRLRYGKSVNVNIWLFMTKVNLAKHVLNLKYGLGVELNNYRWEDKRLQFNRNPTTVGLENKWEGLIKNKLACDYVTVPVMINVNFTPGRKWGYGFSAGASVGYLYSARQKIKDVEGNKTKFYGDFDLEPFKFSWIGEVNLGPLKLYGSYAMKNMWRKGLDFTPFNFGVRLSHF